MFPLFFSLAVVLVVLLQTLSLLTLPLPLPLPSPLALHLLLVFFYMTGGFAAADRFAVAFAFPFGEVALFTTVLTLPLPSASFRIADGLPHPAPVAPLGGVVGAPSRAADMMQEYGFLTVRNLSICAHL